MLSGSCSRFWSAQRRPCGAQSGHFLGYRGGWMATPTAEQINGALRGFDLLYGLELLDFAEDEVRAQVVVREELKQPAGLLHGGVHAAVAESLASLATAIGVMRSEERRVGEERRSRGWRER